MREDRKGLAWGRAHDEPMWMVWAMRAGIILCLAAGVTNCCAALALGISSCSLMGLGYLVLMIQRWNNEN
jgi:CHASE2 domain-containing sensor protein